MNFSELSYDSMTMEEVMEHMTKLTNMRSFYHMTQKQHMIDQIDLFINMCYDRLEYLQDITYFDTVVGRQEGVVLDNMKSTKEDDAKKSRPKRQIRDGSPLQRNPGRKSAFDGITTK